MSANLAGRRVVCVDDAGVVWAIPVAWTDQEPPSPEREISSGRTYLLVDDLLGLAAVIARVRA